MALTPIANVPGSSQMAGTKVPQHIIIVDSSGNVIDSFGGSVTQYTEGDTDTTITGIAVIWEDTSDTLRAASIAKPLPVTPAPAINGGWSVFNATSGDGSTALTNSAQSVKSSQGTLGGWYIYNPNSSATYVIVYNTASGSVTVGTTNPAMVLCIPAMSAANLELTCGIQFGTAISVAATTTAGGNTAPSTALEANFFYK